MHLIPTTYDYCVQRTVLLTNLFWNILKDIDRSQFEFTVL